MFSVDTEEEAKSLLLLVGKRDIEGNLYAPELAQEQTIENLKKFSDKCARAWEHMKARKA